MTEDTPQKLEGVVHFENGPDKHISFVAVSEGMVYFTEGGTPIPVGDLKPSADGKPGSWDFIGHGKKTN